MPRGIIGTYNHWRASQAEKTGRRGAGGGAARGGVGRMTDTPLEKQTTSALLYLDGISVSFDGFKALNELSFVIEPGEMRAIIGPNGAGKTTMMDVITGKTRPDSGDVFFEEGAYDLSKLDETRDRRARHRPQVPEADGVRDAYRRGQSLTGAEERPPRARHAAVAVVAAAGTAHRRHSRYHPPQAACARASPAACRTGRSSGWRSACCWRRSRNCFWWTSRSPA